MLKKYDSKTVTGKPNVPGVSKILEDFEMSRGNINVFLENVTPPGVEQEQILYAVLNKLRGDQEAWVAWEELKLVGDHTVATMLHSKLLKHCKDSNLDAGEMMKLLERMNPDVWAKKSIAQQKNARGVGQSTKLDELLKEMEE